MNGKRTTRKRLYKSLWFWVSALLVSILIAVTQIPIELRTARAAIDNVSNLGIEASNFRFEGDYFWADICFDMPSQADWHVGVPTLNFNGTNVDAFEVGVVESEIDGDFRSVRCEEVSFPVNGASFSEFQIVIHRLEVS